MTPADSASTNKHDDIVSLVTESSHTTDLVTEDNDELKVRIIYHLIRIHST